MQWLPGSINEYPPIQIPEIVQFKGIDYWGDDGVPFCIMGYLDFMVDTSHMHNGVSDRVDEPEPK